MSCTCRAPAEEYGIVGDCLVCWGEYRQCPRCSGQLFSRERVGLSSCRQGPAKPWMSRCSAKISSNWSKVSHFFRIYPDNWGESGFPYGLSLVSELYTNQEYKALNIWGKSTGLPKCCAEIPPGPCTDRGIISQSHHGSCSNPYLCQPNWVGKEARHPAHRGKRAGALTVLQLQLHFQQPGF